MGETVKICGDTAVKLTLGEVSEFVVTESWIVPALATSTGGTDTARVVKQFVPVGHGSGKAWRGVRLSVPKFTAEEPFIFVPVMESMNDPSPAGIEDGDREDMAGVVLELGREPPQPEKMRQIVRSVPSSAALCRILFPPSAAAREPRSGCRKF
ncbi:MAG TPA: hypothetical protein VNF02_02705 [Candidatus Limnocylindrales bacterium]|nr:hypothetical protein [Candidatus Limnocylindrales bacterium]